MEDTRKAVEAMGETKVSQVAQKGIAPRESEGGFTKTRKSERTRSRILATAKQVMAERGSTDFQMSEVASRCEMSKGALYYYFSNREDIVSEIVSCDIDDLIARLQGALEDARGSHEMMLRSCATFARFVKDGNIVMATIANQITEVGESLVPRLDERLNQLLDLIERQVRVGKEEGTVRSDVDPAFMSHAILGTVFFAAYSQTKSKGTAFDAEEFADDLMRYVTHGISAQPA